MTDPRIIFIGAPETAVDFEARFCVSGMLSDEPFVTAASDGLAASWI